MSTRPSSSHVPTASLCAAVPIRKSLFVRLEHCWFMIGTEALSSIEDYTSHGEDFSARQELSCQIFCGSVPRARTLASPKQGSYISTA